MKRIDELLRAAAATLAATSEQPQLEAQVLLAHAMQRPRSWLFAWPETQPSDEQVAHFDNLVARRQQGTPIAYLTGEREFWSMKLHVSEATLIPRPDTECLVEAILKQGLPKHPPILDLGTGTGAIALALAYEHPAATVLATDLSSSALGIAQRNAEQLGLRNITFAVGCWFDAVSDDQRFDLIVSNPPYIAEDDPHLAEGDLRFEPRRALSAGPDGLDELRALILDAPEYLRPEGWLWLEHGATQGGAVRRLLGARGFEQVDTGRDLAGLDRYSGGQWRKS